MSSSRTQRVAEPPAALRSRGGFTLIELLVAMVISGLLIGVIFQLMQGQARFVEVQGARQEVQQNARGTLELIASDLRAAPPGAIYTADLNRIEFLLPRAWGLLCTDVSTLMTGTAWVVFPVGAFPGDFNASAEEWGLALPGTGGSWTQNRVDAIAAQSPPSCGFDLTPVQRHEFQQIQFTALGAQAPAGAVAGAPVFVYQKVRYEVRDDGGSPLRHWVYRSNGYSGGSPLMQPLAGPLGPDGSAATDGFVLRYRCSNGLAAPPGSNASGWPNLTAVQVEVRMASRDRNAERRQLEHDSTMVFLRNSTGAAPC